MRLKLKNFTKDLKEIQRNVSELIKPLAPTGDEQVLDYNEVEKRMLNTIFTSYEAKVSQELSNQFEECIEKDVKRNESIPSTTFSPSTTTSGTTPTVTTAPEAFALSIAVSTTPPPTTPTPLTATTTSTKITTTTTTTTTTATTTTTISLFF